MKKPDAVNVGTGKRGRSNQSIRPSSLTLKLQTLHQFLEREARINPLAGALLLEFERQLGGAVA